MRIHRQPTGSGANGSESLKVLPMARGKVYSIVNENVAR